MKLRETTRKIISLLEEKSGYAVQVVEDKNLATFAVLRIARGSLPSHILSFNTPPPTDSLDFIICWQCALARRLFEREPSQRFQIASSPESFQQLDKILYAPQGLAQKFGLGKAQMDSLRDQLAQGLITHLYSVAVGLRVSGSLTIDYPELVDLETTHVQRELNTNRESLAERVRQTLPREVYEATQTINAAYAAYWASRLEQPEVVNPYRSQKFEARGEKLLNIFESVPSEAAHDYELVDAWAEALGIREWYVWEKYEGAR
ncbi:MAG: hypothetical protein HZB17_04640 [Chloroflexi bacterium]|nr:hypothetical protein [Chloroflexota bacterium]